ncbi:NADP-dependent oxidoreductase [Primorskyibacter flagellatus]|uniref:NADP-dependent oxidoreductase n=1 Tax=Primorskyibacter flagellatus TaxID=1387277 RepID=A0A917A5W0_9RHOB|nr:aldo/keto reductase [Primorskyibacter flagellatus]GGE29721.1 NADP-dependent oxidoreductase [Primorskyibacter flagellatus]
MKTRQLGRTGIKVSPLALGTMGWGSQLDTRPAHAQIDLALDHGVNLIDTSEIYPMDPIRPETLGRTERIIGLWLEKSVRNRADIILSTKQAGQGLRHVRGGAPIKGDTVRQAVEGSLRRLKTDYIDLFQFHWPNRRSSRFGGRRAAPRQTAEAVLDNMADCLNALEAEQRRGTIRAFGLCNETAWGTARWRDLARSRDIRGPVSVQNEYSLLCRGFETDLAELCLYDRISLIASAPLASGLLTGKYQDRVIPNGSRMERMPDLNGRAGDRAFTAVDGYLEVAQKHGLDPVRMALAWVMSRPFVASAVFGASSTDQIRHILDGADTVLTDEVLADIEDVYRDRARPF